MRKYIIAPGATRSQAETPSQFQFPVPVRLADFAMSQEIAFITGTFRHPHLESCAIALFIGSSGFFD